MELYAHHDSHRLEYRNPFGAAITGSEIRIAIDTNGLSARLRVWDGEERIFSGTRCGERIEFCFTPEHHGLCWYYFLIDTPEGLRYYGGTSGMGAVFDYPPCAYQITVYDDFSTPKWFTEGIAYQIFPDRFNRVGRGGLARLNYHEQLGRRTYTHEDWRDDVLYAPLEGQSEYSPCDFFGGDLEGITAKLDYLCSMGVTCIYLNPIFESPSNHRYDTSNYMKIDPVLGDDAALDVLVKGCKAHGIRLMLDGVFSHTGDDSIYFDRKCVYGGGAYSESTSKYRRWYEFSNYPDSYRCWWGFPTLPEINEMEPSYIEFIGSVIAHYAQRGITSWRLDVADELPDEFIAILRREIKAQDPDGVLLGEVWEDASNKQAFGSNREYVMGRELDSAMGYPFKDAVMDFLLYRADAYGLYTRLSALRENYPKPFYAAQLNILGSHDTVRALTALCGAPHRDALTRAEQALYAPDAGQMRRGRAKLILAAILQFTHPGIPCIYYGDEAGATGMADPFCRKPYPWGNEDKQLLSGYRALCMARKNSQALKCGSCSFAAISSDVFAIMRVYDNESALAVVNRSEQAVTVELDARRFNCGPDAAAMRIAENYTDVLGGGNYSSCNGVLRVVLPPMSGTLMIGE